MFSSESDRQTGGSSRRQESVKRSWKRERRHPSVGDLFSQCGLEEKGPPQHSGSELKFNLGMGSWEGMGPLWKLAQRAFKGPSGKCHNHRGRGRGLASILYEYERLKDGPNISSELISLTQRPSPSRKLSARAFIRLRSARAAPPLLIPLSFLLPLQNIRAAKEISFSSPISRKEKFSHPNVSFLLSSRPSPSSEEPTIQGPAFPCDC